MQKSALPKVLVIIVFFLVSIIAGLNIAFAHPPSSTKYVTVTAKNDPGGVVQITYTYNGQTYGPFNTTSVETIKIPNGATVTFKAIPDSGFGFYGWNYTFEPYSMITSSTQFTFSTSQTLTFSNVQNSITAIAFFPVKLTIIDPSIWDYITSSFQSNTGTQYYFISFVGGVAFANNKSLVPSSLVSQSTFNLNIGVQPVGSSNVQSASVSLTPSGSVLFVSNKQLFPIYDPNGLEKKTASITWASPKPWLYQSGTLWSTNDWAWGIQVNITPGESYVKWTLPFQIQTQSFQLSDYVTPSSMPTSVYFPSGASPSFSDNPVSGYQFLDWYMIVQQQQGQRGQEVYSTSNPWTYTLASSQPASAYTGPWYLLEPDVGKTSATFSVTAPSGAEGDSISLTLTFPNGSSQTQTQNLVPVDKANPYTVATFTWTAIPLGSYSWSITPSITYSTLFGTVNATAHPSSGTFSLSASDNGSFEQGISYFSHTYTVTFTESGLPNGITWWAKLGTVEEQNTTPNPIIFTGLPQDAIFSYEVENPIVTNNGWTKYQTSQATGTVGVGIQNITQQISYSTYYLVNVIFNPNYGTSNPQTVWVQAGGGKTFEMTPEEDYYIAQPYSSSITAPSGITINYNSISKTTSGNTYVYNVPVTVNAPGNITVSLTWFNFIDYISENGIPNGQFWSFVIYQNEQQQSNNTALGSPISIEEPGYDYATNSYYIYNITFPVIQAGNVYYVPTSISTSAVDVLSQTNNSVTFEITGNTENNTNIITVNYVPYYAVTINAGQGGSVSWSLVSGYVYGNSSGTVSAGQNQTVYVTWGAELNLTDNPNSGYTFSSWNFSGYVAPAQGYSSNNNPIVIQNTGSTGSVTATYQSSDYLQFTVNGASVNIWYTITLSNGQSQSGNTNYGSSTVTFYLPYGTYSWNISPANTMVYVGGIGIEYNATPASGFETTNASVSINYVLSSSTFNYTWTESGLPSGTQWGVSVNGTSYYTSSSSLNETFSSGQNYSWSVINPNDYSGSPASGSFNNAGSQIITFTQTGFQYTWNESGLPSGTTWGVQVSGTNYTTSSSSLTETFSTGQTYSWGVINPSGYTGTPSTGSFSTSGSQTITFYTGLSVTASANPTSGTQPLTVTYSASGSGGSGSYSYTLYVNGSPVGNTVGPTSGSATIKYTFQEAGTYSTYIQVTDANTGNTANSQTITITVKAPANTYSLTFNETGLPTTYVLNGQTFYVTWKVTVNGTSQSAQAGQSITFTGLSGTVSWSVESPIKVPVGKNGNYNKYYASPATGTASHSETISITYSDPPSVFSRVKVRLFNPIEKIINILNIVLQNALLNFKIFANTFIRHSSLILILNHSFTFI